jgi:hypothetical protein
MCVWMNEWVSDCCLTPNEQLFNYIMVSTCYIQWNDNGVLCTRPTGLIGFFSPISLKQGSMVRHVYLLGPIILIQNQELFDLYTLKLCVYQRSSKLYLFHRRWLDQISVRTNDLSYSRLIVTPPMRCYMYHITSLSKVQVGYWKIYLKYYTIILLT